MKVINLKKKSSKRSDTSYISSLGIQSYGEDNLYPQTLRNIIAASPIGSECVDRYADFIEGNGFTDLAFAEMVVNNAGDTCDDIHADICRDYAMFGGFALHVSYNAFGKIAAISHIPFENVRLCEPKGNGAVTHVAVHPDWSGEKTREGKKINVNKENTKYLSLFDPREAVVKLEIERAGGLRYYGGQVLYVSNRGRRNYPNPKADRVVTEMSTDEGLSNVRFRNTRCNFMPSAIVVVKRGASMQSDDGNDLTDQLSTLQGDERTGKILVVEVDSDDEIPEVKALNSANFDKEFSVTDATTCERIYAAFNQEVWNAIRIGKVGFGGQLITDAFNYYNTVVERERRVIERAFAQIFAHWRDGGLYKYDVAPIQYKTWN